MPLNASLTVSVSNGAGVATSQHRVGPSRQIPIESLPALAGSESEQVQPQAATRSGEVADQCVFLRYYKMKQRKLLPRKIEAAADPPDDSTGSHDDMDITNDAITDLTSMDGIRPSLIPPQSKAHDPVDDILTYILENSDATAALASDEDVYGLDLGDDNDSTNSFTARLEKIRPVLTVNNGLGILRNEKEKSSRIRHDSVTGCTHSCGLPHGVQPSGYSDSLTYEPPAGPPSDSGNPDEGYEYHHDHHDHLQGGYVPPPSPRPSVHEGGSSPISARQYGYQPPLSPPREYGTYGASDATPLSPPTSQKRHGQVWEDADQQQQILFQDSQYTGKKRALLIGINYIGQSAELKSPINDARLFKSLLLENYGYSEGNIVMLTDDLPHPRQIPTQQNILEEIRRLVRDARPGDQLTFFYSGHGGRTKKPDSEEDGCDNDIYPVDFQINGHITSKGMRDVLVTPVPNECRLTAIFDCCISSAILDLPYTYTAEDRTKEPSLAIQDQTPVDLSNTDTAGSNILEPNLAAETEEGLLNADTCMMGLNKEPSQSVGSEESSGARNRTQESKTSSADIISWSCRRDSPRRADILQDGQAAGVMSHALVTTLMENPKQSYQQLLTNISRGILRRKYGLIPQLSSSRPMNTRLLFTC
ncbi:hypothetical protein CERSUDRAFT_145559 [Gelatoporia subvermispora B]|uniref:Peptidase C14 caspase domain-containing protein n=1 Tax=Ceriporiopsis subvermispora (strain B) TaxID=914234 RepID=M2P733_CERS8|nr:hypothetical protein CERSUDRAFT_145559 [Gelatoporia subvermispora B]